MSAHTAPNTPLVKLVIEDDEGKKTIVPISRDEITIGRKDGNTIRLTERNVSRFHARLMRQNSQIFIEDLNSYTGVRVNGDRISGRISVAEGDLIEIGDYHLALQHEGGGEALASQAGAGEATVRDMSPMHVTEETVKVPMPLQFEEGGQVVPSPVAPAPPAPAAPPPLDRSAARAEPTALIRSDVVEAEARAVAAAAAEIPERERAKLVVVATGLAGKEIVLTRREMVLGRTDDNDVVLDHRSVSRNHAKIVFDGANYSIVDLKSANGVLVNGEEYSQTALRPGDIIELGHVRLRFIEPGGHFKLTEEEIAAIRAEAAEIENGEAQATTNVTERFTRGPIDAELKSKRRLLLVAAGVVAVGGLAAVLYVALKPPPRPVANAADAALVVEVPPKQPEVPVVEGPKLSAEEIEAQLKIARDAIKGDDFDTAEAAVAKVRKSDPENEAATSLVEQIVVERRAKEDLAAAETDRKAGRLEDALSKLEGVPDGTLARAPALKLANEIKAELVGEHEKRAKDALESEDFDSARAEIEAGLALVPQSRSLKELQRQIDAAEKVAIAKAPGIKRPPGEKKKPTPVVREPRVAKSNPEEANRLYLVGNRFILQGRFREAIDQFKQALVADTKFADAHRGLGIAYAKLQKNDLAVHHYELYLQLRPFAQDADRVREIIKEYKARKTN
ncbi:MAG: FHA domain-containing protein [Deltaproteobacteria bacterium]|nr:FHA domain-containing protein [Deltaproteobacteria bacterium]